MSMTKRSYSNAFDTQPSAECRKQRLHCGSISAFSAHGSSCNLMLGDADELMLEFDMQATDIPHMNFFPGQHSSGLSPTFALDPFLFEELDHPYLCDTDNDLSTSEICGTDNFTDTIVESDELSLASGEQNPPFISESDISAPKGYISAFNFFVVSERPRVLNENPELKCENNALNKVLGEVWKALPKNERERFVSQANNDKRRYLQEVFVYNSVSSTKVVPRINPPPGCDMNGNEISTDRRQRCRRGTKKVSACVKRPLTAYSSFAQQEKQFVIGLGCCELQKRMGRYFGIRWAQMDPEEKDLYVSLETVHRQTAASANASPETIS